MKEGDTSTCRLLKKPCVIGTKIATKVLKDGDLVEACPVLNELLASYSIGVDAERGVVKILK